MDYLQLPIAGILGIVAPIIISGLKQQKWPDQVKLLVSFIVSFIFGILAAYMAGSIDPEDYVGSVSIVFTVATLFYKAYFAHTDVNHRLEQLALPTSSPATEDLVEDSSNIVLDNQAEV